MGAFRKTVLLGFVCLLCALPVQAALFSVTDSADTTDVGTLRWAISQANSTAGADEIRFSVSATFSVASALPEITDPVTISGGGNTLQANGDYYLFTLGAGSAGSTIRDLVLNNASHGQGTGIAMGSSFNTVQGCVIGTNWSNATNVGFENGISVNSGYNLIGGDRTLGYGNILSGNSSIGIMIFAGSGNSVCGNIIGLNKAENVDLGNGTAGITLFGADDNTIGLPISGWGNVISGNGNYGIYNDSDSIVIQNNIIGPNSTDTATYPNAAGIYTTGSSCRIGGDRTANEGNVLSGNYYGIYMAGASANTVGGNIIGLNAGQTADWGNNNEGIYMNGCNNNVFGSPTTGWGNVISGNDYGIRMNNCNFNQFQGNVLGLNTSGTAFGNDSAALWMYNCFGNLIGGDRTAGAGNVISGNADDAMDIYNDCAGNSICGNVIGLDATATLARANAGNGIVLGASGANAIGLPSPGWGNIIANSPQAALYLGGNTGSTVQNNLIGTNSTGGDFGNYQGIVVASSGNLIGGNRTTAGNVVCGSSDVGIYVASGDGNTICGNVVGLSADQSTALPNDPGIVVDSTPTNTWIGVPVSGWGNVMSGNTYGLFCSGANSVTVQNNIIGLNASGTARANTGGGIYLASSTGCQIGGAQATSAYERNVISGNNNSGILVIGSSANIISGNYLNTSLDGLSVLEASGGANGMNLGGDCYGNLIGGDSLHGNLINGTDNGIAIAGATAAGNTVTGNVLGCLANGAVAAGLSCGVGIYSSAHDNLIGEPGTGQGNLIAGADYSVLVDGAATLNNGIYGNTLTAFGTSGIALTSSGNGSKVAPVIGSLDGSAISGTSSGATDFIEIFVAEPGAGYGGSLAFLGSTTAVGGLWSAVVPSFGGQWVCATASDGSNNTSAFSTNVQNIGATPTVSPTATVTPSPTVSPTATTSPIVTATPTATASPTITRTPDDRIDFKGQKSIAYPNPGRDRVTFAINSTPGASVAIHVYNLAGELVAAIETDLASNLRVVWDCPDIAPGIYIARIRKDDSTWEKIKIAIVK